VKINSSRSSLSHIASLQVPSSAVSFTLSVSDIGLDLPNIPEPPWVASIINIDEILAESDSTEKAAFLATDTL